MSRKEMERIIARFICSDCDSVRYAYARPSQAKVDIERDIKRRMMEQNGYNFTIISHNSMIFTCGYITRDAENVYTLHYYTPSQWDIEIDFS